MSDCILYPAIDLLGGRCVRLVRGDYDQVSVFDNDPARIARRWRDEGAAWLHVVDLDGAREGQPRHLDTLQAIASATGLPIQYSGGLRTLASIERALDAGAARVTLGTAAVLNRPLLQEALERWGERLAVSVDARGGRITIAGWLQSAIATATAFAGEMAALGAKTLIGTNVDRDGTLSGADDALLSELRAALPGTRLIGGGGVASLDDVRRLAALGMDGVLLGRALYEGRLTLPDARRTVTEVATQRASESAKVDAASETREETDGQPPERVEGIC